MDVPWVQNEGMLPTSLTHGISKNNIKSSGISLSLFPVILHPHPLKSFHKVELESSSTRSSFPVDSAKPLSFGYGFVGW